MVNDPKKIVERLNRSNNRALGNDSDGGFKLYEVELPQETPTVDETEVKLEEEEQFEEGYRTDL